MNYSIRSIVLLLLLLLWSSSPLLFLLFFHSWDSLFNFSFYLATLTCCAFFFSFRFGVNRPRQICKISTILFQIRCVWFCVLLLLSCYCCYFILDTHCLFYLFVFFFFNFVSRAPVSCSTYISCERFFFFIISCFISRLKESIRCCDK